MGSGDRSAGLVRDSINVGHGGDTQRGVAIRVPHGHVVIVALTQT
jgi:hypothetical protein